MNSHSQFYWDHVSRDYQLETHISCDEFHYGPLLSGDREYRLLPSDVAGLVCLEAGAGAGQNSIFLTSCGARCTALDISGRQLHHGRRLAEKRGASVHWVQGNLDALPFADSPVFDLIHSSYALPFTQQPECVVAKLARLLKPGGRFILSTAHPLSTAEWTVTGDGDEEEDGVFLRDYFSPALDTRDEGDGAAESCRPAPLSDVFRWLTRAGLRVDALIEPRPAPEALTVSPGSPPLVPYWSEGWLDIRDELERVPVVAIFAAHKPD
ncbi:MAG: class I SAM-dependent methyltransferase [Lentisphaeria bacterium]|nr:class I SAM-dependent methyltransferase [Lentisphaeria bacterium]